MFWSDYKNSQKYPLCQVCTKTTVLRVAGAYQVLVYNQGLTPYFPLRILTTARLFQEIRGWTTELHLRVVQE